jgi:2-methylcitrate dehydratase PrpD
MYTAVGPHASADARLDLLQRPEHHIRKMDRRPLLGNRPVTRELAKYIVELKYEDLPLETIQATKEAVLDQIGIMLMGSTLPWTQPSYKVIRELSSKAECTIVGTATRVAAPDAAFVNANFGHSCEFDDSGYDGGAHPGALTVPPALAIAEREHLGGPDFLLAIVLGYDTMTRIGRVVSKPILDKGFHHQSVVGPFGAATTAGKLLGLTEHEMVHALSIAGSHSSGTMEYDQRGGEVKRIHSSIPVRAGMMAALLAQQGLTGPETILEGLRGIPRVFGDISDSDPIAADLGPERWHAVQGRIVKPFPTLGTLHTSIQAMARLQEQHLRPEDVDQIDVWVNPLTLSHGGAIYQPEDTIGAQFSMAFSLALRLIKGTNYLQDYMDPTLWNDPEIVALGKRVTVHADPCMIGEIWFGARVQVTLTDGAQMEAVEYFRKGSPQSPLTEGELLVKFRGLASAALDESEIQKIIEAVGHLEQLEDVADLGRMLTKT